MKLDFENLMSEVSGLKKDLKKMRNKDKEIIQQHNQIFELLNNNAATTGTYSYD